MTKLLFASVAAWSLSFSAAALAAEGGHMPANLSAQYADAGNGHVTADVKAQFANADGGHVPNVQAQYADAEGGKLPTRLKTLYASAPSHAPELVA